MSAAYTDLGDLPSDACVDMRDFYDPAAGHLRRHDGRHPLIIRRLSEHKLFPHWVREMDRRLTRIRDHPAATDFVATFCNAGRHRSVASALILAHAAAHYGVRCIFEHRSLGARPCACVACTGGDAAREAALAIAWRNWCAASLVPLAVGGRSIDVG